MIMKIEEEKKVISKAIMFIVLLSEPSPKFVYKSVNMRLKSRG